MPTGREAAADGLKAGDRVMIYQTAGGKLNVKEHREGRRLARGAAGVITDEVITRRIRKYESWRSRYTDRSSRRWTQVAEIESNPTPSETVPRVKVNHVLG